ncbi:hypothetical protein Hamer_G005945 [Homarus americanus]|uniref:CCHC-type domain-containing protein n=1 Tax=Homarus americanus TaxID=6706 RepID=A0A8J5JK29_HOMAM|nr:hypothetical protein Hamer_G005945 [Homarus americanus]
MRLFTKFKLQIVMKKFRCIKYSIQESHHSQCATHCPSRIITAREGNSSGQAFYTYKCFSCVKPGHQRGNCRFRDCVCNKCNTKGHFAADVTGRIFTP